MRRIIILFTLNFCLATQLISQVTVSWSDFQDDHKSVTAKRLLMNEKYIYFFYHPQGSGDHYYIQIFDQASFKFIKQIELYPEFDVLPHGFAGVTLIKNNLIAFRSFYNKKTGRNIFYAKKISLDGEVDKKEIELGNIEAPLGKSDPGYFSFTVSPNNDKFLVIEHVKIEEYKTKVSIAQYDAKLNKLWSRAVPYNTNAQRFKIKDSDISKSLITSEGDVYMIRSFQKDAEKSELKDHPKYFYNVYSCHSGNDSIKEIPLGFDDKCLNLDFGINDLNNLIVSGTYSDNEPKSMKDGRNKKDFSIEGFFYVRIDPKTEKILASAIHEFSSAFLQSFESSDLTDNKKGIYDFDLNDLSIMEDGSVVISGQQYYYSQAQGGAPGDVYMVADAHARDIYAVKISNDGAIGWERLIKKSQHGSSGSIPMTGYEVFTYNDDLFFIFNDHPKNISGTGEMKEIKSIEESVGRMVKVDSKGNLKRSVLFDNDLNGAAYYPGIAYHIPKANTAIIFASTEHHFKLGKLQFK